MANKNTHLVRSEAVVDINAAAATAAFAMDAPRAGYLVLNECWGRAEEATGTQTGTQGVVSIEVGGTEVASFTCDISQAIGHTQTFTPDGTNATAANPVYPVADGDEITCVTKTQAAGGTVTGTYRIYLSFDYGA